MTSQKKRRLSMKATKKVKEVKSTTIRIPLSTWKELRRLEESGHIVSIQQAMMLGTKMLMEMIKRGKLDSKE
jgi:hypothetical protein